ncbi:MAG: exosortase/archaeosortase family protein [Opitutales bacterium]
METTATATTSPSTPPAPPPSALPKAPWGRLDRTSLGLLGLVGAFMAFVIWDQSYWWASLDDYFFGYLVPLFVAFVVFERLPKMKSYLFGPGYADVDPDVKVTHSEKGTPIASFVGYMALVGSIVILGFSGFVRAIMSQHDWSTFGFSFGLCTLIFGVAFVISERNVDGKNLSLRSRLGFMALFTFPALIWLVSAPLLLPLEAAISTWLLKLVTIVTFDVFNAWGVPIIQEGNILVLPNGKVHVEDACSGIRSLTACIFAGSFLAAVFVDKTWKKVMMVVASMLFAFLFNIVRSVFLTGWTNEHGQDAIDRDFWGQAEYELTEKGTFVFDAMGEKIPNPEFTLGSVHDVAGYMIVGFTMVALLMLLPIFSYRMPQFDDELLDDDSPDGGQDIPKTDPNPA